MVRSPPWSPRVTPQPDARAAASASTTAKASRRPRGVLPGVMSLLVRGGCDMLIVSPHVAAVTLGKAKEVVELVVIARPEISAAPRPDPGRTVPGAPADRAAGRACRRQRGVDPAGPGRLPGHHRRLPPARRRAVGRHRTGARPDRPAPGAQGPGRL